MMAVFCFLGFYLEIGTAEGIHFPKILNNGYRVIICLYMVALHACSQDLFL